MGGGRVTLKKVKARELKVSPHNVRKKKDEKEQKILTESIKKLGLLQPLVIDESGHVISGGRRATALKELGKDVVVVSGLEKGTPIAIQVSNLSPIEKKILSLAENIVRKDLELEDIREALNILIQRLGSIEAVADELGIPVEWIHAWLSTRLIPAVKREKKIEESPLFKHERKETLEDIVKEEKREEEKAKKIEEYKKATVTKGLVETKLVTLVLPADYYTFLYEIAKEQSITIQEILIRLVKLLMDGKVKI